MEHDDLRTYNLLQYDRIDKLESKRENFCNYVITITSALYTIGLIFLEKINFQYFYFLVGFIILLNFTSVLFNWRTRPWIKLHQMRAKLARKQLSQDFEALENEAIRELKNKYTGKSFICKAYNKQTYRLKSDGDFFRRSLIYSALHWIIIGASVFLLAISSKIEPDKTKPQINEVNINETVNY